MDLPKPATSTARIASFTVINPSGGRTNCRVDSLPFRIGRQADNHLVLRDNRASRVHAHIIRDSGEYVIEDLNSRQGVYVNGTRVSRCQLANGDRIDFGLSDSYQLVFNLEEADINRLLDQLPQSSGGGNLAKLRSVLEVARAAQSSLTTEEVLAAVVDSALAITGTERGFLLLRNGDELTVSVARDRQGGPLACTDLKVPTSVIGRALRSRRELLSMSFDPLEQDGVRPEMSVADLELRGVVCLPLIRVRAGSQDTVAATVSDTVGLLYLDSRLNPADLSSGNRELLQTLALEASTILENARLLQEEREKRRMEEELNIARQIQRGLLPRRLPMEGWLRAAASSIASLEVGGDYYDLRQCDADTWCAMVADVSGKGVSSALLASLLQGAFLFASEGTVRIGEVMSRINHFLLDRTEGEKYATVFYCTVDRNGRLSWANAGHPRPLLVRAATSELVALDTTGLPLGMLEMATYGVGEEQLQPGDHLVIFSDGVSEAENPDHQTFEKHGFHEAIRSAPSNCVGLHAALLDAIQRFTAGAAPADDITLLVLQYCPPELTTLVEPPRAADETQSA